MKWIKNNYIKLFFVIICIIIICFYTYNYIFEEKEQYIGYNDYYRADYVMTLTYNKNFQFYTTRQIQALNSDKKISEGELIYDYSQYNLLPMLKYLNEISENKNLIDNFTNFLKFWSDYNYLTIGLSENIFVKQSNGKYYKKIDDIYRYYVELPVFSKKGLNKVYNEYLKMNGYTSVEDKFLKDLYKHPIISEEYTYSKYIEEVSFNYDSFYSRNKEEILDILAKDLENFNKFLYTNYIYFDENNYNTKLELLKTIDTETIQLTFDFKKYERIYSSIDKHYTHSYVLDINDVWEQLEKKGYPKIYS